jgi:tetratricopeptide (TPR) repeat protein
LLNRLLALAAMLAVAGGAVEAAASEEADALSYGAYLSARIAADEHDMADAAKFYRQSLARDPKDASLLALAFFYETSAGEVDSAADLAKRVIAVNPDDRASRLVLAVSALKRNDYAEARDEIQKSGKTGTVSLTVALVDAWAAAGAHDDKAALADIDALHGQAGAEGVIAFHKALILEYLGRNSEADAVYSEAVKADNASPRLINAYGRFLERNGRAKDATALYNGLASNAALSPIVNAARARIAKGEKPDALIRRPQDGVAEALFGIAASLTDESSADVSVLYLRLALYLEPDFDLANILLGDRLETLGKIADAIAVYRKVGAESPYQRLAAIQIATDEARLDKDKDAIRDLKALTDADPNDIQTWSALGDAYRADNRFAEAAGAYDKAIAAVGTPTKKDWILYFSRAAAYDRAHNWAAAEADLKLALKLAPEEPQILNYLGYSWVDQGRNIPEALKMLERARALKPYDGYIIDSVGWAYYKLGRYGDAARTLEDAILLVPGDPTINDHYGDALWKVGRKLDARFQWNHALAFGPEADQKTLIEKKLQADFGDHS